MALDANDLVAIRKIFTEAFNEGFDALIQPQFDRIYARLDGQEKAAKDLQNEIYAGFGVVNRRLISLEGKVEALENDVKEIYQMAV